MNKPRCLYRVSFIHNDKMIEIYAKNIIHDDPFGFIECEGLVFGDSTLVVDPNEEKLRNEFQGVKRTFIPLHHIVRIDEVEKQGVAKITVLDGTKNKNFIPTSIYKKPDGESYL